MFLFLCHSVFLLAAHGLRGIAVLADVVGVDGGGRHLVVAESAAQGVGPRGVGVQHKADVGCGGAVVGSAGVV